MQMHYLDFDYSEDDAGHSTWDALACVAPARWPALCAEVAQVLAWCTAQGAAGALDEGALWDVDVQASAERGQASTALAVPWQAGQWHTPAAPVDAERVCIALTISTNAMFSHVFRQRWYLD